LDFLFFNKKYTLFIKKKIRGSKLDYDREHEKFERNYCANARGKERLGVKEGLEKD